ncbi:MAG: ATP-binding protein [Candidatus Bathyarchaeia archaeon]
MDKWMGRREILLVKGPRQSGKTTLLLHLEEKHGGDYVTLEDADMLEAFKGSPRIFAERFLRGEGRSILFLDEAQYSGEVGKTLKLLFDLFSDRLKLIATGSGSFDVKVEVGKYLVGRAVYFELLPLSFEEFLSWKAGDLHRLFLEYRAQVKDFISGRGKVEAPPAFQREFNPLLEEYIIYGGFPGIVKEGDEETKVTLLKNLVKTYVEKDVFFFLNIRETEKFKGMLRHLSLTVGSPLEFSSLMSELRMDYRTLKNYLSILVSTYMILLIPPYRRSLVTELKKSKKPYFTDTGLRNTLIDNFLPLEDRTDKGPILENYILNELRHLGLEAKYWRTTGKAEVDFIVESKGEAIPIEVKSTPKMGRGLLSFIKAYKPGRAIIFNDKEFGSRNIDGTKVVLLPYFYI